MLVPSHSREAELLPSVQPRVKYLRVSKDGCEENDDDTANADDSRHARPDIDAGRRLFVSGGTFRQMGEFAAMPALWRRFLV
jgi:hypothetical protein